MVRSILIYGLALLTTTTRAIIIPPDLPDGLHTFPLTPPTTTPRHRPRQLLVNTWTAKCSNSGPININDFATAKENLQTACDRGEMYRPNMAVVYATGSAVAYFCNYEAVNGCSRSEYEEAMLALVGQCGIGNGGEVVAGRGERGYGGDNRGVEICV